MTQGVVGHDDCVSQPDKHDWLDQYWNECSCGLNKEMSQMEYFELRLGQSGLRPDHLNSERLPHGK